MLLEVKRKIEPNVFYKAESFHFSAKIINESNLLNGRGGPFIVNAMFALELYLKSVLSTTVFGNGHESEGGVRYDQVYSKSDFKGKGHNLFTLYEQLPESIKSELELLSQSEPISLSSFFDTYKNHFIEWRYSYEGNAKSYKPHDILSVLNTFNIWASKEL
tara:strand:+ start:1105 stop:1587 length:483 start_codon:yes stop_codon:yes gene_type:complete